MCEPIYDDVTLELISDMQRKDLVLHLWQYILALEDYVVRLRCQVNTLSYGRREPYPDPASDFAIRFYDHPGYDNFSGELGLEELSWTIQD